MEAWHAAVAGAGVAILGIAAYRGHTRTQAAAKDADAGIVEQYCRLVAEQRYAEAYESCLTRDYRKSATPEKFAEALAKRHEERGAMQGRELLLIRGGGNLFTGGRELQLHYALQYPGGPLPRVVVVNDSDGSMRIDGTYVTSANSTLSFEVW